MTGESALIGVLDDVKWFLPAHQRIGRSSSGLYVRSSTRSSKHPQRQSCSNRRMTRTAMVQPQKRRGCRSKPTSKNS